MSYSLNVDFNRRLGKSISSNKISSYEIKKNINECENNLDKRKIFNDYLSEIFKHDLFLCNWLYYEDYDNFLSDFKEYILELDDEYFNIIINSDIHLGNMVDIFWMEKNDPKLRENYNYETALEEHKKAVEKNNYKFDNDDRKYEGFKLILKELTYKRYNQEIYDKLFKLKKELEYARMDDILHMRTELQWKILYSLRYVYKNVVNKILANIDSSYILYEVSKKIKPNNIFSFDETTPVSQLYKIKKNIEDYLMFYQESTEGLEWHNPYSDKPIENIEYFPRETSKPLHKYAYAEYYDLKNTAFLNLEEMLNQRKKRNEEIQNNINERFNKIHKLMQERDDKVKNIAKFIGYGIKYGYYASIIIGISVISYYFFN